ncbi:hypothetical protein [Nostoc sp. FACHB-190]|nr:hypothetical protein [Nostoc sp. FACHB-190]
MWSALAKLTGGIAHLSIQAIANSVIIESAIAFGNVECDRC